MLLSIVHDLRFALRQLRRAPFFSLSVMLTLALSIGATAALTGVLRATLLHPLPYLQPQQLVVVSDENLKGFKSAGLTSIPRVQDLAGLDANGRKLFSQVSFYYFEALTLAQNGQTPEPVPAVAVSGSFFATVGTAPLLGRTLTPADDVPNGPQLLVISYKLWQTRFAGDPSIVGRTVRLGADPATIIGVMPKSFALPTGVDLWHPGHVFPFMFANYRGDGGRFANVIARLAPGETIDSARLRTGQLATRLARQFPESDSAWGFTLTTLRDSLFGPVRQALLLLAAAVGLVLLVAAVNIAGLQLSRNSARAPEFAIRTALGVTWARLTRQLLTESLLLGLSGGLAGIALAAALLKMVAGRLPGMLLLLDAPHVDAATLAVALGTTLLVGLFTGALPVLRARHAANPAANRSLVSRRSPAGKLFATAQIAISVVLLTLSASVLQNLYRMLTTPLGFEVANLQTFTVDLPWGADAKKAEENRHLYSALEDKFAAMPGVESAGSSNAPPFTPYSFRSTFDIEGQPPTPNHDAVAAQSRTLSPGYLHTMRIPLLAGRALNAHDAEPNAPRVMLINQSLAHTYFAATNPIGKRLDAFAADGSKVKREIVGILGDVRGNGGALNGAVQPEVYTPADGYWPHMQFVLRTTLPRSELERQVKQIVSSSDAVAQVGTFASISSEVEATLVQPKLNASLLTAFAALSLLLVVIGVYGLVAFDVAQRTRELGLRLALGSSRNGVVALLLADSTRILTAGLVLGIIGSFAASRLIAAAVFGPQPHLALLLLASTLVLTLAVVAATLLPAACAARIDPMEALRTE
jgi:putative ABC transport system permease protein